MRRLSASTKVDLAIVAVLLWIAGSKLIPLIEHHIRNPPLAATISYESATVNGVSRQFRLVVPDAIPADDLAVVLSFHGSGDTPHSMANYSRLDQLAANHGFILVYPAALDSTWSLDTGEGQENPDVQFVDQILKVVAGRFDCDPQQLYLAGMSDGATFAQLVAAVRPQVTALVAHSGAMRHWELTPARRVPILLLVGAEDPIADDVLSDAERYRAAGHPVDQITVPGSGHTWSHQHNTEMWRFLSKHHHDNSDHL